MHHHLGHAGRDPAPGLVIHSGPGLGSPGKSREDAPARINQRTAANTAPGRCRRWPDVLGRRVRQGVSNAHCRSAQSIG